MDGVEGERFRLILNIMKIWALRRKGTNVIGWIDLFKPHKESGYWMEEWNDRACEHRGLDMPEEKYELLSVDAPIRRKFKIITR